MHRTSFVINSESTTVDFASEAVVCAASVDAFAAPISSRNSEIIDVSFRSSDFGERSAGHENCASRQNEKPHRHLTKAPDGGVKDDLRLFDTSNLPPIRIMHQPNSIMYFALRPIDALDRMMPRLLDTSNLLPINMMWTRNLMMRFALRKGEALQGMKMKLPDITNLLLIKVMHRANSNMPFVLRRGEVCRRIKLKLLDTTNWLSIRMMYRPNSIPRSALRRGEMFQKIKLRQLTQGRSCGTAADVLRVKRSPIAWPIGVELRTTTPRSTRLRERQRVSGVDG
jgi:hypothetical protein